MALKIVVDVNLSPTWCDFLATQGHEAVHWTQCGMADATDEAIMAWAAREGHVVFTHDLDFGAVLAATRESRPSVMQVRCECPLPEVIGTLVASAIVQFREQLLAGAIVTIDARRSRARLLPFP